MFGHGAWQRGHYVSSGREESTMAVVIDNKIVVNGYEVGTVDESKYDVPTIIDIDYPKSPIYVIS